MSGDDDKMFMTRSLNVTPKTTEQDLIARCDKSVAYLTNNKRLRSTCCTEANYDTDRHEASRGLFATADLHTPALIFNVHNLVGPRRIFAQNFNTNYPASP